MFSDKYLSKLYWSCWYNFVDLFNSNVCGCINCLEIFPCKPIEKFELATTKLAWLCPKCHKKLLVFESKGFNLTYELLKDVRFKYKDRIDKKVNNSDRIVKMIY